MTKKPIAKEAVIEAASRLIAAGQFPTLAAVRNALGGRGSQSTLHKYLNQWKQACFKKGTRDGVWDTTDYDSLLEEKYSLEKTITQQIEQNADLTGQLMAAEQKIIDLSTRLKEVELIQNQIEESYKEQATDYKALQLTYQDMKESQDSIVRTLIEDKNQQIESLMQELKELNQASLDKVSTIGYQGDEALMTEKVKNLNLQEKASALEKLVSSLQQQRLKDQQANQALRSELEKQKKLIEEVVTFEKLQAMEPNNTLPGSGQ